MPGIQNPGLSWITLQGQKAAVSTFQLHRAMVTSNECRVYWLLLLVLFFIYSMPFSIQSNTADIAETAFVLVAARSV